MNSTSSTETRSAPLSDAEFKDKLAAAIPHLRAFGRSLCGDRDIADDLVQETMLKAWAARARFEAGTNFRAWTFTILRNQFFTQARRYRFVGEWDDLVADRLLAGPASQDKTVELRDMMRALQQLPGPQREALILVGAGGMSYEQTAEITGVAVGTVKSRVARARTALEAIMAGGILETRREDFHDDEDVVVSIFAWLEKIQAGAGARSNIRDSAMLRIAA